MKIEALTVCVDYCDVFSRTLPVWAGTLDRLVVVTAPDDHETQALCAKYEQVQVWKTDAFYRDGASFNKGRAIQEGLTLWWWDDWQLFFDADILPPPDWREQISGKLDPLKLNGANRWQLPEGSDAVIASDDMRCHNDNEFPGYFQLFNAFDPAVKDKDTLIDTCWTHAGNYDSSFQARWGFRYDHAQKIRLPLKLLHLGAVNSNWFGLRCGDSKQRTQDMYRERTRKGGVEAPGALDGEKI